MTTCILTAENMHTADDCTLHEHETESMKHPLELGTRLLSHQGEQDADDETGRERCTGPNAIGEIVSVQQLPAPQGWSYGVVFQPSGVWVFIDEFDMARWPGNFEVVA